MERRACCSLRRFGIRLKRAVPLLGLVLGGCATSHKLLVGVPVAITCIVGVGTISVMAQGVAGDPGEFCAKLSQATAETVSEPRSGPDPTPEPITCIQIGERWDCRPNEPR